MLGPTALEAGIAIVEELLDPGLRASAHDAPIRAAMARGLARIVELCRGFGALPGLGPSHFASPAPGELWPEPHDRRFDFPGTADGAEWIDALAARRACGLAAGCGEIVLGHCDWRAEHVRFAGEEIVATYDWQSLALTREPELVGSAAHAFTADWGIPQARRLPTLDEARAFVADYEAARGARFSPAERDTLDAAWVYATAYGARCEHSDARLGLWQRGRRGQLPQPPRAPRRIAARLIGRQAARWVRSSRAWRTASSALRCNCSRVSLANGCATTA